MARRIVKLLPALALVGAALVAVPAPATAQATRTWISGVGDDANPCSRTAPCRSLAGAFSKTAAGGEINAIDPVGAGALTITKSITINGCNVGGIGVLTNVSNGITVNATDNDKVTLRCLDINGLNSNFHGIRVLRARSVKVTDTRIYGFNRNGISLESATNGMRVTVARSFIHDNGGAGVMNAPANLMFTKATLRDNEIVETACGVVATAFGPDPAFNYATNCGTASNANGFNSVASVNSFDNLISESGVGVFSRGSLSVNRIGLNQVVNNGTGLQVLDGGQILSFGNNLVAANGTNGAPTGPLTPMARHR